MNVLTQRPTMQLGASYLLTESAHSTKIAKGEKLGVLTGICYLSPAKQSGAEMCPWRSAGCTAGCLQSSGRMRFTESQKARLARTRYFLHNRAGFRERLYREIDGVIRRADRRGMLPAIRLNGTSDVPWEHIWPDMFQRYGTITFYDYTKSKTRMLNFLAGKFPDNYYLTFSRAETPQSEAESVEVLAKGGNVAVVFDKPPVGGTWKGFPVINGEESDCRFFDLRPAVVGLKAKGKAIKDSSGFVVRYAD